MGYQSLYVCYSINDIFAREAGISLIGMLENNPDYEPDEVFFLDYGIHPVNKQRLGEIAARYGKHVTFLNAKAVTDSVRQLFPKLKGWRGSMAPNAKAFVDQIIPDYVGRLLFIDADTLVSGSLSELRTLDMSEAVLGVVPSNTTKDEFRKKKIELANGNQVYFNSGVLLYELNNWRRENCHQMILDTLKLDINLDWPDQSLLNNAIPQRIIRLLPPKFNYHTHCYAPSQERRWMRRGRHFTDAEIFDAIHRPAIIHYLSGNVHARPWYEGCKSRRKDDYLRYKALSPWKDTPLFPPTALP